MSDNRHSTDFHTRPRGEHVMVFAHPMLGALLTFTDYDQGYAVADDLGFDWDLSAHGFLKSRGHIVHTDTAWPAAPQGERYGE